MTKYKRIFILAMCLCGIQIVLFSGCKEKIAPYVEKNMEVTVTAYNSLPGQTTATDSDIAAWGDTLKPGMKAVAVSRDLMHLGLVHNKKIRIEGLEGEFVVLDKMNTRHRKKIDIYMGINVRAAKEWGRKKRTIYWEVKRESDYDRRYQYQSDTLQ